jgi:hypothetical protein
MLLRPFAMAQAQYRHIWLDNAVLHRVVLSWPQPATIFATGIIQNGRNLAIFEDLITPSRGASDCG